ncbi:MAG: SPOR domain-containing protein [Melioribacteraceae bacterium]
MKIILSFVVLLFSISACSIFQETTSYDDIELSGENNNTEEVYVFDEGNSIEESAVNNNSTSTEEIEKIEQEVSETITGTLTVAEDEIPIAETIPVTETEYSEPTNTSSTTYEKYQDYGTQHYIQLGAFSSLKRAERFSSQVSDNVSFTLSVLYQGTTSLYVVRSSAFATKGEAEATRNDLRRRNIYKDSFIITE